VHKKDSLLRSMAPKNMTKRPFLILLSCMFLAGAMVARAQTTTNREPIKGRVEHLNLESGDNRYDLKPQYPSTDEGPYLKGNAQEDALKGNTDASGWEEQPGVAELDKEIGMLKGAARKQGANLQLRDPDAEDQQLMIEWDRWRNRLLRAVQLGTISILNNRAEDTYRWDAQRRVMRSKYPMGTEACFICQVTPNLKLQKLKILNSSGFPEFDEAVLQAVRDLEDTKILKYPERSKRPIVSQAACIRTATSDNFQYHKFGDVERQVIPK